MVNNGVCVPPTGSLLFLCPTNWSLHGHCHVNTSWWDAHRELLNNEDGITEHCLDNGTVLPMKNKALAAALI